jgi:hypothetical protein
MLPAHICLCCSITIFLSAFPGTILNSRSQLSHKGYYYFPRFPEPTISFKVFISPTAVYRNAGVQKSLVLDGPND